MTSGSVKNGMVAGFAATAVMSILILLKQYVVLGPTYNPIADWQQLLSLVAGTPMPLVVGWVPHVLLGIVVWGSAYAYLGSKLPGHAALKGLAFGALIWMLMMVVFLPIAGHGLFGLDFGLGLTPAGITLLLHLLYGLVLGLVYARLGGGERTP